LPFGSSTTRRMMLVGARRHGKPLIWRASARRHLAEMRQHVEALAEAHDINLDVRRVKRTAKAFALREADEVKVLVVRIGGVSLVRERWARDNARSPPLRECGVQRCRAAQAPILIRQSRGGAGRGLWRAGERI
jgi:hypothetical protein